MFDRGDVVYGPDVVFPHPNELSPWTGPRDVVEQRRPTVQMFSTAARIHHIIPAGGHRPVVPLVSATVRTSSPLASDAAQDKGRGVPGPHHLPVPSHDAVPSVAGKPRCYFKCLLTSLVISNMLTVALPPKTAFSAASALIMRLFFGS